MEDQISSQHDRVNIPRLTLNKKKLYEIKQHTYLEDGGTIHGIVCYFVAESSKDIYHFLLRNEYMYKYKHGEALNVEYILQVTGFNTVHELIIHAHGDENVADLFPTIDDGEPFSKFSWKMVKQNISNEDINILKNYGICIIEYDNITQA